MITTNVDRAIELLEQKGESDIKEIAKTLGTKQDSVDLILSYLEEEGLVELKYGVFHTLASLKKKEEKKEVKKGVRKIDDEISEEALEMEKKSEAKPLGVEELLQKKEKEPQEKKEAPKIIPKQPDVSSELSVSSLEKKKDEEPKIIPAIPKFEEEEEQIKPSYDGEIPLFDEKSGSDKDKKNARLANMMIKLLGKSKKMGSEEINSAGNVFDEIISLAKQNKIYVQKGKVPSEFTLGSLLFSARLLMDEYKKSKNINLAKKVYSTYSLIRKSAMGIDSSRLKYYRNQITGGYDQIMSDIYPVLKSEIDRSQIVEEKKKLEEERKKIEEEQRKAEQQRKEERKKEEERRHVELRELEHEKIKAVEKARLEEKRNMLLEQKKMLQETVVSSPEKSVFSFQPSVSSFGKEEIRPKQLTKAKQFQKLKPVFRQVPETALHIPRFREKDGRNAMMTNSMLNLLEKYYSLPFDKRHNAVLILNDLLKLAKQNHLYAKRDSMSAEFILCSLFIGIETLIKEYEDEKTESVSKKITSTYHLMREIAMEIDKDRLQYYKDLISQIYTKSMEATFP